MVVCGRSATESAGNTRGAVAARRHRSNAMNEFYVGYQPKAPAGIHRRIVAVVLVLMILGVVAGVVFSRSQRTFASATFEYGSPRTFEGIVQLDPYPMLVEKRPGQISPGDGFS